MPNKPSVILLATSLPIPFVFTRQLQNDNKNSAIKLLCMLVAVPTFKQRFSEQYSKLRFLHVTVYHHDSISSALDSRHFGDRVIHQSPMHAMSEWRAFV
jgi:predicted phage tail protein